MRGLEGASVRHRRVTTPNRHGEMYRRAYWPSTQKRRKCLPPKFIERDFERISQRTKDFPLGSLMAVLNSIDRDAGDFCGFRQCLLGQSTIAAQTANRLGKHRRAVFPSLCVNWHDHVQSIAKVIPQHSRTFVAAHSHLAAGGLSVTPDLLCCGSFSNQVGNGVLARPKRTRGRELLAGGSTPLSPGSHHFASDKRRTCLAFG